jgi:hypothetical protein
MSWPWTALLRVQNSDLGVELWYAEGIALAPTRAFFSPEEQQEFSDRARQLAA